MAKAAKVLKMPEKEKAPKEKPPKKKAASKSKKLEDDTLDIEIEEDDDSLSNYQETEKTGRVDSASKAPAKRMVLTEVRVVDRSFLSVSYSKIEADGSTSNHAGVVFDGRFAHPDTLNLFQYLRIHFALACEFISVKQLKSINDYNQSLVEKFTVLKVKIKKEEGVSLTGYKLLGKGPWNFTAPFIRFTDDEQSAYRYIDDLTEKVELLEEEVIKYIDGSKVGKDPQGTLEFPDDNYSEEGL